MVLCCSNECLNAYSKISSVLSVNNSGSYCVVLQIMWWMGSGSRTSFSLEDPCNATCQHHPLLCPPWAQTTEQEAAPLQQKQAPPTCLDQVRWMPVIAWRNIWTKYYLSLSCIFLSVLVGSSRRQDMIGGQAQRTDVIMRKRSENRGYTDENIRDSIVMGDVMSKFSDLSKFEASAVVWIYSRENVKLRCLDR